jgi:hypothetical protein
MPPTAGKIKRLVREQGGLWRGVGNRTDRTDWTDQGRRARMGRVDKVNLGGRWREGDAKQELSHGHGRLALDGNLDSQISWLHRKLKGQWALAPARC